MGQILETISRLNNSLPKNVSFVAISKTKAENAIMEAYNAGVRMFGENKVQELGLKYENLPKDIQWHFIGHLQTNKVKYIASYISLIHSVDSLKLLVAIDKEAKKCGRVIDCLLQFHVAQEETKWGLTLQEAIQIVESDEYKKMNNVRIVGVMGMASFTNDENQIRAEFAEIKQNFDLLKIKYFQFAEFKHISMGMSHDYEIAVEQGSTLLRIGTTIFGNR